jgi:hypothetical protein
MTIATRSSKKSTGFIKSSTLILLAFATAFFSRVLDNAGAPSTINFVHFATIPLAAVCVVATSRSKNRHQVAISWSLLIALFTLLGVMLASALLNEAGIINVVLDFMLLGEPFILLLALVSIPMSSGSFQQIKKWLIYFNFAHISLAYFQCYVLRLPATRIAGGDLVQGAFYFSGAGHVVGSSVALIFGMYYFVSVKSAPLWLRGTVLLAAFWQMIISDAKQVILTFMVAGAILMVTKFKDIGKLIQYLVIAIVFGYGFLWCMANVPAFRSFNTWVRPEIYGPDGEATLLKSASLRIIPSFYESPVNWLLGLGPGHTVGRLGGWMLEDYWSLLSPFGATIHPASQAVWDAVTASWLGDQSSMFSPLYGWAGIWGDLGLLGLGAYLYLGWIVWQKLCKDDFSKFLVLNVFVVGLIFSQMEEPGYMLTVATLIGLQWQEHRATRRSPKFPIQLKPSAVTS